MLAVLLSALLCSPPGEASAAAPSETEAETETTESEAGAGARGPARLLEAPRIPAAGPVQPWVTLNSWSEYIGENYDGIRDNEGFVSLVNRLNAGFDARLPKGVGLGLATRVDTQTLFFPRGPVCDQDGDGQVSEDERAACRFGDDYRLERFSLRLTSRWIDATLGDFNVQFGRGFPLSVRNVDQLGIDPTIKGGRVDLHSKWVEVTALAGQSNRANSDYATRQLVEDPGFPGGCELRDKALYRGLSYAKVGNPLWTTCSDLVAGARVEGKLPAKIRLAANYAHIGFGEQIAQGLDEAVHVAGGDLSRQRIAETWDLYAGGAALVRTRDAPELDLPSLEGVDYTGHAAYLANTFYKGGTTLVVEAKHYRNFLLAVQPTRLQYSEAPTLEREDQQVPGNFSSTGGRARLDHRWPFGLTLFANAMAYAFAENLEEDPFSKEHGLLATHGYAGAIFREAYTTVQISFGYRYELHRDDGRFRRRFPHVEFYANFPIAKTRGLLHSGSFRFESRFEDKQVTGFADERFVYGQTILGYALAPYFQIAFIGGFSTEFPAMPGTVSLSGQRCDLEGGDRCKPHLWPGVEFKATVAGNNFIRVFVGRQVGGRICVNGSCRTLPDFEGVRAELVLSF